MTPLIRRLSVSAALLLAAAAWSGSALAASGPVNLVPPHIDGRPQVGHTLTTREGTWLGSPTSFVYQWQRCEFACVDIPGAIGATHVVVQADAGFSLKVEVKATSGQGETAVTTPGYAITTFTVETPHFVVHYVTDPATGTAITETQAGDVGAIAERAYAAELADGYPAPLPDGALGGDSRIDIYVVGLGVPGVLGTAQPDGPGPQTPGYILLEGSTPLEALTQSTVAHELFHLIQFGIWLPPSVTDYWLLEASAEWMAYRADGFQGGLDLGNWDMALDCRDLTGNYKCDLDDDYRNGGYSRWPFFEYVAERWGPDFTRSILAQGAAGAGTAANAVANAVAAKGTSLADVFTDWTVANLTGAYSVQPLQSILPPIYASVATGTLGSLNAGAAQGDPVVTAGPIASGKVAVNHLSARFVALRRGDGTAHNGPCYKATLDLRVALPAGVGARPYFWWSQRSADGKKQPAQPLSISGTTASITLPWDTCDWGSTQGYLSLPNPTTNLDAQDFTITGTITVDRTTEATATPPPDPVAMPGTIVDASESAAPRIEVFGPQLIRLAAASRALRLIVSSSDSGSLKAALGSRALGSVRLRPGSNDVRFALPVAAVRSLRRVSAATSSLTLTPVSAAGEAGKPIVRRVAVVRATAKPKAKAKAKPKAKPKRSGPSRTGKRA